jgi:hypothetical protein
MSIILKTIYGREVGLDRNGFLSALNGIKTPTLFQGPSESEVDTMAVTAATTAAAFTLPAAGTATLGATAGNNPTYALPAPVKGLELLLFVTGLSTGQIVSSTASAVTIQSTVSSSNAKLTFGSSLGGQSVILAGLSTSLWGIISNVGSVSVSTV